MGDRGNRFRPTEDGIEDGWRHRDARVSVGGPQFVEVPVGLLRELGQPVDECQIDPSLPTSRVPSGLKARKSERPGIVKISWPLSASQSLTLSPPLAIRVPSGLNATLTTALA